MHLDCQGCPKLTGYLATVLDVAGAERAAGESRYIGTGADQVVGPQFFLQTSMTVGVLMVMVVNALAFRPSRTTRVAIYGGFSGMILEIPRTAITTDPLVAMTGMGVAPRFVVADMVIVMVVGATALAVLTRVVRRMAVQAVRQQHASDQLASPLFLAGRGRPYRQRR